MERLADASGDSYSQIARALKLRKTHERNAIWRGGKEGVFIKDEQGYYLANLLDATIEENTLQAVYDGWGNEISSPESSGWWRDALAFDLEVIEGFLTPNLLEPQIRSGLQTQNSLPKTDAEITERLKRTEQTLAEAMSQSESLKIQLGEAQKTIDDLRRIIGDQSAIAPHNTHLMKIAIQAQRDYWGNPESPPKQEVLIGELMEKYSLSEPEARAVERVACPINRKK